MVKNLTAIQETDSIPELRFPREGNSYSSVLVWRTPQTEEPGKLQSLGWQMVKYNSVTNKTTSWNILNKFFISILCSSSDGEASACNTGDLGLIPESGRSLGEGNGNPLQYSCLENPMDRGAWQAAVHGVTKSQTQPSD